MKVVGRQHIIGHVALVYINVGPLSTLRLVASHGIGEFNLQGIVVGVGSQFLDPVCL
jgi:hypothetical protein